MPRRMRRELESSQLLGSAITRSVTRTYIGHHFRTPTTAIAMAVGPTNPEKADIWFARSIDADSVPGWVWVLINIAEDHAP